MFHPCAEFCTAISWLTLFQFSNPYPLSVMLIRFRGGLCLKLKGRYYPVYPAWTCYAQSAGLNPKMNSSGRVYFEKLPEKLHFVKQPYNPADGWLDS